MEKNLKLSYILLFAFSMIVMAFKTLTNFFNGVGVNCVGLIALVFVLTIILITDKPTAKRVWDMFTVACALLLLELIIYFACEFGIGLYIEAFSIFQNIISFLGVLLLAYVGFRFVFDYQNKKLKFIEILLGNEKRATKEKKTKKSKEITNGSLLEKPNSKQDESATAETLPSENQSEKTPAEQDSVVIIETEE